MIEIIVYTISGILLYIFTDGILSFLEGVHGEPLPYRSVIFFVIIFLLAVVLFQVLQMAFMGFA